MSCARRVSIPGQPCRSYNVFNPLIPPCHNCAAAPIVTAEEPVCRWSRCPQTECVQYSCSGDFDMRLNRPKCADIMAPPTKDYKCWCTKTFGHVLPHCTDPCPPSRFICPEDLPEEVPAAKAPWRESGCPQFLWSDGYATTNTFNVPYPEPKEGLKFRNTVKPVKEGIDPQEVELWSLTCLPANYLPPLWKTMGKRIPWCCRPAAPLTLWKDGRPKPNSLRLPYPGHGFKFFDSCHPCHRRHFPCQVLARNVNGVFKPPGALCGKPYCI